MKKLKGFRKVFLIAMVISLCFASCKQPQDESKTETVTVTVKKDEHVTKAVESFLLKKGEKLGEAQLKDKSQVEFEFGWELSKICLGNDASGKQITDIDRYEFTKSETIFVVSQKKQSTQAPKLVKLTIDGLAKDIQNFITEMDFGQTSKSKVKIEAVTDPLDAPIQYVPPLEEGYWNVGATEGKKSLKLIVGAGGNVNRYQVNIEKIAEGAPRLIEITLGGTKKEGADITSNMLFSVTETEAIVECKVKPEGATVTFTPNLVDATATGGKLTNIEADTMKATKLKIEVEKDGKKTEYNVEVKKRVTLPHDILSKIDVWGSAKQGIISGATKEQLEKIIKGDKDVEIEVAGPIAVVQAASQNRTWEYYRVNGIESEIIRNPFKTGYWALSTVILNLGKKGESIPVKIEVKDDRVHEVAELNFKIKRTNDTVDLPISELYIRGRNVIKGDVLKQLSDGSKPQFEGSEPSLIEVATRLDVMENVKVLEQVYDVSVRDEGGIRVFYVQASVIGVNPDGKDVTIEIQPKDKETYHALNWRFHLKHKEPEDFAMRYEINGKNVKQLPSEFIDGIANDENPEITVDSKFLNLKLFFDVRVKNVVINDVTLDERKLRQERGSWVVCHSVELDSPNKQINIMATHADTGAFKPKEMKFKATGNEEKEGMNPLLRELSQDQNLKVELLNHLTDGTKPLWTTAHNVCDIYVTLTAYECDFLCKEVKVNDELVEIERVEPEFYATWYKMKKSVPISKDVAKDIKIEFIPYDNVCDKITWEFKAQSGGSLPTIPQVDIRSFRINDKGGYADPLPDELIKHLTDGTQPTYVFDGKKAHVVVGVVDPEVMKEVVFKIDGSEKHTSKTRLGTDIGSKYFVCDYTFELDDTQTHPVELEIRPTKTKVYSPLVYTFKLQRSGNKLQMTYLDFFIDDVPLPSGTRETVNSETASIGVDIRHENLMKEVWIGEKGGTPEKCPIEAFVAKSGTKYWEAKRTVSLLKGGATPPIEFEIRVVPLNAEEYDEKVCHYTITGTKSDKDNAEFVCYLNGSGKKVPLIDVNVQWIDGISFDYTNAFGAKMVSLKASTVNAKSTVKYQLIDTVKNEKLSVGPQSQAVEGVLTNTNGVHTAKITLFQDKTTRIKLWVVSESGHDAATPQGKWQKTFNPVTVNWDYDKKGNGADYKTRVYDLIEIEKAKVAADKKIYIVFKGWKEENEYIVVKEKEKYEAYQSGIEFLEDSGNYSKFYRTEIDVSDLIKDSNPVTELVASFKVMAKQKPDVECINYKVKIKVKP